MNLADSCIRLTGPIDGIIVLRWHEPGRMAMVSVKVSPKFQIVIPKQVREQIGLRPGQRFQVIPIQGRIELVPVEPVGSLRGFAKGISTDVPRDEDRV